MILAAAAAAALSAPSREVLIERWLHANRTHTRAQLEKPRVTSVTLSLSKGDVGTTLQTLAQRELAVPGRYQLSASSVVPAREPWWLQVWDWVSERWHKFWNAIFGRVHVGTQAAASFGDVLLVAVTLLLIFVAVRLLLNMQFARSRVRTNVEPLSDAPSPRALYRQACNAANRGDYGTAALLLFAATVALLDRHGAVRLTSSATVGDLRRDLRAGHKEMLAPFDAVAAPFVQRAYAERAIDEPQWERARSAFATLSGVET